VWALQAASLAFALVLVPVLVLVLVLALLVPTPCTRFSEARQDWKAVRFSGRREIEKSPLLLAVERRGCQGNLLRALLPGASDRCGQLLLERQLVVPHLQLAPHIVVRSANRLPNV
jgi:hypothetical protein